MNTWVHPTGGEPKRVAVVALGDSRGAYETLRLGKGPPMLGEWDEVWTLNRGLRVWEHDLGFVLDDLRRESYLDPDYGKFLREHVSAPYVSCKPYPEFPGALEYPLAQVIKHVARTGGRPYLQNSVPCILAYADLIGVQELLLVGADYTRPDGVVVEAGRANVEYWLGRLEARGMKIALPNGTTLCSLRQYPGHGYIYGWDEQWRAAEIVQRAIAEQQAEIAAANVPRVDAGTPLEAAIHVSRGRGAKARKRGSAHGV